MRRTLKFPALYEDLPKLGNPGMTQANNCIWTNGAYRSLSSLSVSGDALDNRCQGVFAGEDEDGNVVIYAGDSNKLYQRSGTSWNDKSNGTYNTQFIQQWKFSQFGTTVIATNFANTPQQISIGGAGNFSDLTDAPNARHVGVIGQFVFLGNTSDSAGTIPHRVRWSAIGDATDWPTLGTTDATNKQSDAETLNPKHGKVQAISDGERFGLVFQETGITRFTYVGGSSIFEIDTYERTRGLLGPLSYAQLGDQVVFLASSGFYRTDGVNVVSIGTQKIDSFVLGEIDTDYPERISTAIDFNNKLIYFSYPNTSATSGTPNRLAIYNYVEDKWTTADQDLQIIFSSKELGFTLDQLDTVSASIDTLSPSLDSSVWTGGSPKVGGFGSGSDAQKLGDFSGAVKTATLDTLEAPLNQGGMAVVQGVRPLVEGGTATVSLLTRDLQSASQSTSSAVSTNARTGMANFRSTARYHAVRLTVSGGFDSAIGADVEFDSVGSV